MAARTAARGSVTSPPRSPASAATWTPLPILAGPGWSCESDRQTPRFPRHFEGCGKGPARGHGGDRIHGGHNGFGPPVCRSTMMVAHRSKCRGYATGWTHRATVECRRAACPSRSAGAQRARDRPIHISLRQNDRRDLETEQDAESAADRFARRMSGAVSERLQARPDSKRKVVLLAFDLEERLIGFVRKQLVVGSSRLQNA